MQAREEGHVPQPLPLGLGHREEGQDLRQRRSCQLVPELRGLQEQGPQGPRQGDLEGPGPGGPCGRREASKHQSQP